MVRYTRAKFIAANTGAAGKVFDESLEVGNRLPFDQRNGGADDFLRGEWYNGYAAVEKHRQSLSAALGYISGPVTAAVAALPIIVHNPLVVSAYEWIDRSIGVDASIIVPSAIALAFVAAKTALLVRRIKSESRASYNRLLDRTEQHKAKPDRAVFKAAQRCFNRWVKEQRKLIQRRRRLMDTSLDF